VVRQSQFSRKLLGDSGGRIALTALLAALAVPAFTGVAGAGTFACTWTDAGANWTTAADWSNCNSTFPNNTSPNIYNPLIPTGDPLLTTSVAVGSALLKTTGGLALNGGTLKGTTLTLTDGTDTISGNGILGSGSLATVNGGTIDASTGTLTLNGTGGITNSNGGTGGLLEATNSGTLSILNAVNNAFGNITASGAGSTVSLDGGAAVTGGTITANAGTVSFGNAIVTGSTLTTTGGGVMRTVAGKTPTLNGVTISTGSTYTQTDGTTSDLTGTITNNGTIALNGGGGKSGVLLLTGNTSVTGGGIVQMTDSTGGGNAFVEGNGFTLTNTNNTISGTGTIGNGTLGLINNGTIEAATAGGTKTLALNGTGGVTNNATFAAASGAILGIVPSFTNTGTIHALNGGTVTATGGFNGTAGTAQIDAGGTLNVGASSTVGTLIQNGTLGLGANHITVSSDYIPLNFGTTNSGNSFEKHAGVNLSPTNPGDINAAGPNASTLQAITGADVTGGGTATPTLNLGNVRVGSTTSTTYAVENTGATGNPSIRGAIQTSVDGGNITDPGLSGSGVTAQNFGPIASGSSSGGYAITYAPTTAGALSGQTLQFETNFDNVDPQTMTITGSGIRLASGSAAAPLDLGAARINSTLSGNISVSNTAPNDGFSENLDASITGTTPQVTGSSGSVSGLGAGQTNSSGLSVSLNTAAAGAISGTATVGFQSDGTGIDGGAPVGVGSQTVTVSGSVYRLASGSAQDVNFGNVRINAPLSGNIGVTNAAANDGYSENLDATITGTTPQVIGSSGSVAGLAAGQTNSAGLSVSLNTAAAGAISGTATVGFQSDGTGIDGGAPVSVGSQTVNAAANVYRLANPVINTSSPVSFAARVGDTVTPQTLSITNSSPDAYTEDLAAAFGTTVPTPFTGTGSIAGLAAQGTDASSLSVGVNTSTAGNFTGAIPLDLASTGTFGGGTGSDGGAPVAVDTGASVSASADIYTPAIANVPSSVNFGIVHVGDGGGSLTQSAVVQNGAAVTALNDVLIGSISGGSGPLSTSGDLGAGLGPQISSSALKVTLNTGAAGIFSSTANFSLASHDAQLADLPLAANPLDLQAQVNNYAALAFVKQGGKATLTGGGSAYTLDFGTVAGGTSPEATLAFLNNNPLSQQLFTDLLSSTGTVTSGSGFAIVGASVSDLPGGDTSTPPFDVTFDANAPGAFDEVLTFDVGSSNSSGYDQVLGDVTLTLEGDVVPEPGSIALLGSGLGMLGFAFRRARRGR
jgi:PEP-CTERM motif